MSSNSAVTHTSYASYASYASSTGKRPTIHPLPAYPQIVLALNLISTEPFQCHWLLFVPFSSHSTSAIQQGRKLHAVEDYRTGRKVWCFDSRTFTLATSASTMAAAVIGRMPALGGHTLDNLVTLLSAIEMNVVPHVDRHREPKFSCRVWVREALRRMHANGYINCPDVDALEAEMWHYGREARDALGADTFTKATLRTAMYSRAV